MCVCVCVSLRDPRRGGNRRGLDGRQPVLDRRRTQENHQRGSFGKGLTDPQNSHRGQNDSPPSHRGGPTKRVRSGREGGFESLCCCSLACDTMMDDPPPVTHPLAAQHALSCCVPLFSPLQRRFFYFLFNASNSPTCGGLYTPLKSQRSTPL